MARKTPQVIDGVYHYYDTHEDRVTQTYNITEQWERWLEDLKTFKTIRVTVTTKQGFTLVYSVNRHKHPNHPLGFWVAVKKIKGKRRIKYIGADTNMTTKKFTEVAPIVVQPRLPLNLTT